MSNGIGLKQIIPMIASAIICSLGIYLQDRRLVIASIILSPPVTSLIFDQPSRKQILLELGLYLFIVLLTGFVFGLLTFRKTQVLQLFVGRESEKTVMLSVIIVGILIGAVLSISDNITYVLSAALALSLLSPLVVLGTTLAQKVRDHTISIGPKIKRLGAVFGLNLVSVMVGYYATKFILSFGKKHELPGMKKL